MKKTLSLILVLSLLAALFGLISANADDAGFQVKELGHDVSFHTELQEEALAAGPEHFAEFNNNGQTECSIPKGIELEWTYSADPHPQEFTVALSMKEDMSDPVIFTVPAETEDNAYHLTLQNLFLGTTYYYTIAAGDAVSEPYTFSTSAEGPRNLFIDGVTNARDLGGWKTNDGHVIRQGLLFRCGELNVSQTTDLCITEEGIRTMREDFGIRSEIDFRRTNKDENGGITESPLGSDVNYYHEPINIIIDVAPDAGSVAETFRIFADKSNYPIAFHCAIGTDRTGFISYLLLSLCDVRDEDLLTDYFFSNLGLINGHRDLKFMERVSQSNMGEFITESRSETARLYLKSLGLTDEELDTIVSIMVE